MFGLNGKKIEAIERGVWGFFFGKVDSYIYEKMGSLGYFFGRFGAITTQESEGLLRCYFDLNITYKNPDWTYSCDYITGIDKVELDNNVKIFPNPATEIIKIETKMFSNGRVNIYNLFGIKKITAELDDNITEINIKQLSSGIYFVECIFYDSNGNKIIQKTKITKK